MAGEVEGCPICHESLGCDARAVQTECGHLFCGACLIEWLVRRTKSRVSRLHGMSPAGATALTCCRSCRPPLNLVAAVHAMFQAQHQRCPLCNADTRPGCRSLRQLAPICGDGLRVQDGQGEEEAARQICDLKRQRRSDEVCSAFPPFRSVGSY